MATLFGFLLAATPVLAAPVALSDAELAGVRGGLETPNGFEIGFGATVRTYVDGQLVLQTNLTWTDQGPQTTQTAGAGGSPGPLPGSFTVTLPGPGGATQVLQDLTSGRIASVVLNTANNRTIRQDTDVTLVVPQLADLQRQAGTDRMAASLQSALGTALRDRSGP